MTARDYMPLLGPAMFFVPLFILAEWAHRKGKKLEAERIRASDEALYREVYGPGGKPTKNIGAGQ
jgi:hypothetical protein